MYALTPDGPDRDAADAITAALLQHRAVRVLQYRSKQASETRRLIEAEQWQLRASAADVCFLVNDSVALAAACGADGVHLGEHDEDPKEARAQLGPEAIIGVSCYDSLARAESAIAAGADYVAFGACFPSRSKATHRRATPALFAAAREAGWSTVAIGGLREDNVAPFIAAGADWVAMIDGLYGVDDPVATASRIASLFARKPKP